MYTSSIQHHRQLNFTSHVAWELWSKLLCQACAEEEQLNHHIAESQVGDEITEDTSYDMNDLQRQRQQSSIESTSP